MEEALAEQRRTTVLVARVLERVVDYLHGCDPPGEAALTKRALMLVKGRRKSPASVTPAPVAPVLSVGATAQLTRPEALPAAGARAWARRSGGYAARAVTATP